MKTEMPQSLSSLQWDAGEITATRRGPRLLKTAAPTQAFWTDWRDRNAEMREAGVSVRKNEAEKWVVSWWLPVPVEHDHTVDDDNDDNDDVPTTSTSPSGVTLQAAAVLVPMAPPEKKIIWSPEQEAIFGYFRDGTGSLVVRARAGTGKTTTIKAAFAQAPEANMLYVVFNKKNQREAKAVITDRRVDVRTLHSLGLMFIKKVWTEAEPDKDGFLERERVTDLDEDMPAEVITAICKLVSFAKNTTIDPTHGELVAIADLKDINAEDFEKPEAGGWSLDKLAEYALKAMASAKVKRDDNKISFDDMVWLPVVKGWVRGIYDLICVDECQDMNRLQLEMAVGACKQGGRMCVVGDDRQAIYGFRGATSNGIDLMKQRLEADELGLTVTRRCPKSVVSLVQPIVPDFKAAPEAPEGFIGYQAYDEALMGIRIGDAFLSRINAPLMSACLSLIRRGVPARIEGRDIGKTLAAIVKRLRAKSLDHFYDKLEMWRQKQADKAKDTHYAKTKLAHIDDQYATLVAVAEGCASVPEVEQRLLSLFQDSDSNTKPAVVFSSVHKAKGLEWERVYMLQSTFRRKRGLKEPTLEEKYEEDNIYYVACTRTKDALIFVSDKVGNGEPRVSSDAPATSTSTQQTSAAPETLAPASESTQDPKPAKKKRKKAAPKEHGAATSAAILGTPAINLAEKVRECPNSPGGNHSSDNYKNCQYCGKPK